MNKGAKKTYSPINTLIHLLVALGLISIGAIALLELHTRTIADSISVSVTVRPEPSGGGGYYPFPTSTKTLEVKKVHEPIMPRIESRLTSTKETLRSTKSESLPPVQALYALSPLNMRDTALVAKALQVPASSLQTAMPRVATLLARELKASMKALPHTTLVQPTAMVLAALSIKNPELSTERGQQGFIRDVMAVVGVEALQQAQTNASHAALIASMMSSMALGDPLDRRTFDQEFYALGEALLAREREVITSGVFQRMMQRLPKTTEDWPVVKNIAYRGRTVARNIGREEVVRKQYERAYVMNIAREARSTSLTIQKKVAWAWSVIRAIAASDLALPSEVP